MFSFLQLDFPNSNQDNVALNIEENISTLRSQLDEANAEKEAAKSQIQAFQQQLQVRQQSITIL